MKILLTGASGFLGAIFYQALQKNHTVITLGRSKDADITCDLSTELPQLPPVDMVIHNAGLAHRVPKTDDEKQAFFRVNEEGTNHLLRSLARLIPLPKTIVFISTVAVYGKEEGQLLSEETMLEGDSPYALSKIKAEKAIMDFGKDHQVSTVILRLPLVVGQDAPGNLGAMIKGIVSGVYFRIGDGATRRSMVLAEDIAALLPQLIDKQGVYHLTDGVHPSFAELENAIAQQAGRKVKSLPLGLLKLGAYIGDRIPWIPLNTYRLKKMTSELTFSDQKARQELGWKPNPVLTYNFF